MKVYPIKNKSQIVEVLLLKEFLITTNQHSKVCKLRCDNNREYLSKETKDVCRDNSIQLDICSIHPKLKMVQYKGHLRTLGDKQRCPLEDSQLPWVFGLRQASYAAYLYNRIFS